MKKTETVAPGQRLVTKEVAGKRLRVKVRRVTAMIAQGYFKAAKLRDQDSGQMVWMVDEESLDRYIKTREAPAAASTEVAIRQQPAAAAMPALMAALLDRQPPPVAPLKPWMTVAEAAEYSGLPASFLLRSIEGGKQKALDIGSHHKGGRWRLKREWIDAIEGMTVEVRTKSARA